MAPELEALGRGRDMVAALRLAQAIQPRDDTAMLLEDAIGKYGFRISENSVQADLARPRICATFTEDLVASGVDYSMYVKLPEPGLSVENGGYRELCVAGLTHGQRYSVTFREGLPAADGQTLAKDVALTLYVRDRNPGVSFPGRGYVLPKGEGAALPVQTVNTEKLDLTLFAVTDRNLLRAMQNSYFGAPVYYYSEEAFTDEVGEQIWHGTATVAQEVNKDVTTRLPMAEALAGRPAGVYALRAVVPGVDPGVIAPGWQWFVVSDLGLTTMNGVDGLHVFVRSLSTAGAKPGATVELLNRANAVLGTATTDDQGYARFDAGLTRGSGASAPALVVVKEGEDDIAFLSLTDPEFDLSDRGCRGARGRRPGGRIPDNRPRRLSRRGDVYATALARDPMAGLSKGLPLTALLKRPDGVEYSRQQMPDSGAGGYVFEHAGRRHRPARGLDAGGSGRSRGPPLAARPFSSRISCPNASTSPLMGEGDQPLTYGEGGLSADGRCEISVRRARCRAGRRRRGAAEALPRAEGLARLCLWCARPAVQPQMEPLPAAETLEDGRALIDIGLPQIADPGRPLTATVTVRVAEGSGRPVERRSRATWRRSRP
jgi:hypothetical protein